MVAKARKSMPRPAADVGTTGTDLSEFEFGLIVTGNGFLRWVERCLAAATGRQGLNATDALLLHAVNHRARGKRLSEICMVMNIEARLKISFQVMLRVARRLQCSVAKICTRTASVTPLRSDSE